jgi:uncharacterized protein YqeY
MALKQQIIDDFKQAFKEKDMERKNILAMVQSEMKNKEIELMKREAGLSDDEVIQVISKMIKQRKDSAEQFRTGGREELAAQELKEVAILEKYLPEQLSDEAVEKAVKEVLETAGIANKADMGKAMGAAMAKLKGQADGNKVREMVEKLLQ